MTGVVTTTASYIPDLCLRHFEHSGIRNYSRMKLLLVFLFVCRISVIIFEYTNDIVRLLKSYGDYLSILNSLYFISRSVLI